MFQHREDVNGITPKSVREFTKIIVHPRRGDISLVNPVEKRHTTPRPDPTHRNAYPHAKASDAPAGPRRTRDKGRGGRPWATIRSGTNTRTP